MLHSSEIESQLLEPLTNMFNNFQSIVNKIEMAKPYHKQSKKLRKYIYDSKVQEVMREKFRQYDRNHAEPSNVHGIFMAKGITSNLPVMAGVVLKGITPDGSAHLRPICTTGDLMLALNQLMDPTVFVSGAVQLPDPHKEIVDFGKGSKALGASVGGIFSDAQTTFRTSTTERVIYRLDYVYRSHMRWFKLT